MLFACSVVLGLQLWPIQLQKRDTRSIMRAIKSQIRDANQASGQAGLMARSKELQEDTLLELFRKHDDNGDGVLDFGEFSAMLQELDSSITERSAMALFNQSLALSAQLKEAEGGETGAGTGRSEDDDDDDDTIIPEAFVQVMLAGSGMSAKATQAMSRARGATNAIRLASKVSGKSMLSMFGASSGTGASKALSAGGGLLKAVAVASDGESVGDVATTVDAVVQRVGGMGGFGADSPADTPTTTADTAANTSAALPLGDHGQVITE